MAKATSVVSIVVVVGLVALVFAVGGGLFRNFSIEDGGLDASPTPTQGPGGEEKSIVQQISDYISSLLQPLIDWILDFFDSLGTLS